MANALVGRKNLLDITYYPVILTRGSWESSLPLANLKDPLLVNAAQRFCQLIDPCAQPVHNPLTTPHAAPIDFHDRQPT